MIFMRGRWQAVERQDREKATYSVVGGIFLIKIGFQLRDKVIVSEIA